MVFHLWNMNTLYSVRLCLELKSDQQNNSLCCSKLCLATQPSNTVGLVLLICDTICETEFLGLLEMIVCALRLQALKLFDV